jgi:hypothetical protein
MIRELTEALEKGIEASCKREAAPHFNALAHRIAFVHIHSILQEFLLYLHAVMAREEFAERTPVSPEDNLAFIRDQIIMLIRYVEESLPKVVSDVAPTDVSKEEVSVSKQAI